MFKHYFSLTFVLSFAFLLTGWQPFISEHGKFKISTPGALQEKVNAVDTKIGALEYHTFFYQEKEEADNLMYMVSYVDYPEGSVHSDSMDIHQDFFDATIDSSVKSVKGELFYSSEIKLGTYPGRLWRVVYKDGEASIRTKAFLVNNRFYTVQTITLKDKSLNPSIDKFMDSFQLIEKETMRE